MGVIDRTVTRQFIEELVQLEAAVAQERLHTIQAVMQENGFFIRKEGQNVPMPLSPGALFLDPYEYAHMQDQLQHIIDALMIIRRRYISGDPLLRSFIQLPSEEMRILEREYTNLDRFGCMRFDLFPTAGGARLTEVNTDNPDVIVAVDKSRHAYFEQCISPEWQSQSTPPAHIADMLLGSMKDHFGDSFNLGILCDTSSMLLTEYEIERDWFEQHGIRAVVGSASEVFYDGGRPMLHAESIDVIRRVTETSYYAQQLESIEALLTAIEHDQVKAYNSFSDRILGHKTLFAVMSNPRFAHLFTTQQLAAISELVPWTRLFTHNEYINVDGKDVPAMKYAIRNQDRLLVKPAGQTAARGVTIGREVTGEEWRDTLEQAAIAEEQWILQEVIEVVETPVLEVQAGETQIMDRLCDLSIMAFYRAGGVDMAPAFGRYNSGLVNNILQGGAFVFPFLKAA